MKVNFYKLDSISKVVQPLLAQKLPAKTAYWLNKLSEKIISEMEKYESRRLEGLKSYAILGENGEVTSDDKGQAAFRDEETRNQFYKKCDEIRLEEITINFMPLTIESLGNAELTPYDVEVLLENSILQDEV